MKKVIKEDNSETFLFLSDAKSFQRKKMKEGFKTKLIRNAGISFPNCKVYWAKK